MINAPSWLQMGMSAAKGVMSKSSFDKIAVCGMVGHKQNDGGVSLEDAAGIDIAREATPDFLNGALVDPTFDKHNRKSIIAHPKAHYVKIGARSDYTHVQRIEQVPEGGTHSTLQLTLPWGDVQVSVTFVGAGGESVKLMTLEKVCAVEGAQEPVLARTLNIPTRGELRLYMSNGHSLLWGKQVSFLLDVSS